MPATIGTQTQEDKLAKSFKGLKHERIRVTDVDDNDSLSPGSNSILYAAWEPDSAGEPVGVVVATPSAVFFDTGANGLDGYLHIWSSGY